MAKSFKGTDEKPTSSPPVRSRRLSVPLLNSPGASDTPGYALPTISFSRHATGSAQIVKPQTLKAGASRSRPSSVSTIRAPLKSNRSPKSRGPDLTNIFKNTPIPKDETSYAGSTPRAPNTPIEEYGQHSLRNENRKSGNIVNAALEKNSSSSYKSPSLAYKVLEPPNAELGVFSESSGDRDLNQIMKETQILIGEVGSSTNNACFHSRDKLLGMVKERQNISKESWRWLVNYHCDVSELLQDKIKVDHKLIQNVLELNNIISTSLREQDAKLSVANFEIMKLQSLLGIQGLIDRDLEIASSKSMSESSRGSPQNSAPFYNPFATHDRDLKRGIRALTASNDIGTYASTDEDAIQLDPQLRSSAPLTSYNNPKSETLFKSNPRVSFNEFQKRSGSFSSGSIGGGFYQFVTPRSARNVYEDIYQLRQQLRRYNEPSSSTKKE